MEKTRKKELLIIVPGAKSIKSRYWIMQKLILLFCHFLSFHPLYPPKEFRGLIKKLKYPKRKIRFFRWSRGFLKKLSVEPAAKRLAGLIKRKSRRYKIKIVAFSVGAGMAQLALDKIKNEKIKIETLMQLAAFNYEKRLNSNNARKVINIFSDGDKFVRVGMDFLEPFKAGQEIRGRNVKNISIPGLEHENFSENYLIRKGRYKNKRIFDLYKKLLKS